MGTSLGWRQSPEGSGLGVTQQASVSPSARLETSTTASSTPSSLQRQQPANSRRGRCIPQPKQHPISLRLLTLTLASLGNQPR